MGLLTGSNPRWFHRERLRLGLTSLAARSLKYLLEARVRCFF